MINKIQQNYRFHLYYYSDCVRKACFEKVEIISSNIVRVVHILFLLLYFHYTIFRNILSLFFFRMSIFVMFKCVLHQISRPKMEAFLLNITWRHQTRAIWFLCSDNSGVIGLNFAINFVKNANTQTPKNFLISKKRLRKRGQLTDNNE